MDDKIYYDVDHFLLRKDYPSNKSLLIQTIGED